MTFVLQIVYTVSYMDAKNKTITMTGIAIAGSVVAFLFFMYLRYEPTERELEPLSYHSPASSQEEPKSAPTPKKTEFGNNLPENFPTNIPVEKNAKVNQSYSLDYAGFKQLSIVFPTKKTINQNYALYAGFLKDDGWSVTQKYESAKVSSLYAKKKFSEINITVTPQQVSVSVLQK